MFETTLSASVACLPGARLVNLGERRTRSIKQVCFENLLALCMSQLQWLHPCPLGPSFSPRSDTIERSKMEVHCSLRYRMVAKKGLNMWYGTYASIKLFLKPFQQLSC